MLNLEGGHDGQRTTNLKGVKLRLSRRFKSRVWDLEGNLGNSEGGWLRVINFEYGECISERHERVVSNLSKSSLKLPLSPEAIQGKVILRKRGRKVPACLTVIRALSRGLEKQPLVLEIFLGSRGVRECVGLVILGDEVGDDGA